MCIFVVLCVDETLFYMREYSDAIELPKRNISAECECIANIYIWTHF